MARYALVAGIAKYSNSSLPDLSKTATDAAAVAEVLKQHGSYRVTLLNGEVKAKQLADALKTLLREQAVKNEALIYFTGHGIRGVTGVDILEQPQGFLAASDCNVTKAGEQWIVRDGVISLNNLNQLIRQSDLSNLVVIFDSCHSGEFLERGLVENALTVFRSQQDYYLITACRRFEQSWAKKSEQHSVFTGALLAGLSQERAGDNGQVTVDRLFDYIASELSNSRQEPIRMGVGRSLTLVQYPPKKTAVVVDETCPYQGLQPFGKEQARFFFGREKVVQLLMEKLGQANFVPIIGASGSGKSSVLRAGLIPQLEKNGWRILEPILPGVEPLAELKRALLGLFGRTEVREIYALIETDGLRPVIERMSGSERLLLVIDQFEEVFTVCPNEEERRRFIDLLTQVAEMPASRLAIVTTMRADFLEPCLSYESVTRLIQNEAVYMPLLVGAELEEAIASPAELQGYRLERGLLGAIQQDVNQEKGCLPLLQFALTELWEQRDQQNHLLTLADYKRLGGVIGSLNRHAEQIYQSLTEQQKIWVKRIFLKLVRTSVEAKDTRQRQPKSKLLAMTEDNSANQQAINDILDQLVQGRLLVTNQEAQGESSVDLAHEALMDGWEQFARWREESQKQRRLIDRIEDAYQEWFRHPQDENLMMGGLLSQAREYWTELEPDLPSSIRMFYQQSDTYQINRSAEIERLKSTVYRSAEIEKLKSTMYHYMTQELTEELLKLDDTKLGGDRKEVSVLFSDIHSYTTLTEKLSAEEVVGMLNEYFELMVEAVFQHKGTLDKYIGDAIMAVFGSPLPLADHAWRAVQTAIEMRHRLIDFNDRRSIAQKTPIQIGIGITSHSVISNNIGSNKRREFTTIGDDVRNLGSRLESATRQYGCDIIISEFTYRPCADLIWYRELDSIQVKGKIQPVKIYEVVGLRSDAISPEKEEKIELYHKGREYYLNRKFTRAMGEFGTILEEIDKNDKAATLYLKRCQHYLQEPPPDDWDGAWTIGD